MRSTIVLVHGAFADSASWDRVVPELQRAGHPVVAAANPLRGLASDAESVSDLVRSISGPVVLVAHSYGGAVMTNVDPDAGEITALVYVNGFAPDAGENCFGLATMFPGSTVGDALQAVPRHDGTTDLSILPERFRGTFAADVDAETAALMAVSQRPATQEALTEPSGGRPLWKELPSWFVYGEDDLIIPGTVHHFMAERAHAWGANAVRGGSHALPVSRPGATAQTIIEAAAMDRALA
jgi:pimeloyl-ACP methyl ester carboxylesterase